VGAMPGNIVKGPILKKFDDFINKSSSDLKLALDAYESSTATAKSILEFGVLRGILDPLGSKDTDHIVNDWIPEADSASASLPAWDPRGWWPRFFPLGEILCQGLANALRVCFYENPDEPDKTKLKPRGLPLPIDTYWVCAGSHFEVAVLLGHAWIDGSEKENHVTMLILTPPAPGSDRAGSYSKDKVQDIWIARHDEVEPYMKGVRTTPGGVETVRPREEEAPSS